MTKHLKFVYGLLILKMLIDRIETKTIRQRNLATSSQTMGNVSNTNVQRLTQ